MSTLELAGHSAVTTSHRARTAYVYAKNLEQVRQALPEAVLEALQEKLRRGECLSDAQWRAHVTLDRRADAETWARIDAAMRRAECEHPPIQHPSGLIDLEPTLARVAELLEWEPAELVSAAQHVLGRDGACYSEASV